MAALCIAILLSGCASVNLGRADWCVRKGKLTLTVPLDPLPRKEECKSRELFERILR